MRKKRKIFEKGSIKKRKKAQTHFPFQLIFSLVLIAVFLITAFFVIRHFLELQRCSQIGLFVRDLQESIDEVWQAQEASTMVELDLPSSLSHACFVNLSSSMNLVGMSTTERENAARIYDDLKRYFKYKPANFFLYPWQKTCKMPAHTIEHVDITSMTNPYCFRNINGKVKFRLVKGFDDVLVKVRQIIK
jgi:hypothetical protein